MKRKSLWIKIENNSQLPLTVKLRSVAMISHNTEESFPTSVNLDTWKWTTVLNRRHKGMFLMETERNKTSRCLQGDGSLRERLTSEHWSRISSTPLKQGQFKKTKKISINHLFLCNPKPVRLFTCNYNKWRPRAFDLQKWPQMWSIWLVSFIQVLSSYMKALRDEQIEM